MSRCRIPECNRDALASSSGAAYAMCDAHARSYLAAAFGSPDPLPAPDLLPEWRRRALARRLPGKDYTRAE